MNYKRLMKPYKVDMLDALQRFLAIPSVYDESTKTKEMPFGKDVNDALQYIANLGKRFGFEVDYCDGYATELTIGSGDRLIGIFAHSDVVPITGEWKYGAFVPTIENGNIYARGSSDDKGPLIAAFYAAKALNDNGLLKNYRVRIVVGGDEERGSSCLVHYFEEMHKEAPTYGFTPDSDFPLIYGEKGITDFHTTIDVELPMIEKIEGGVATNAVCDNVKVTMKKDDAFIDYLGEHKVNYEVEEDGIRFLGKACHGSTPQFGINAALIALKNIGDFYKVEKLSNIANNLSDTTGQVFNGFNHSKLLGDTTYCVGIISYEKGKLYFTVNFRYNENVNPIEFKENLDKVLGTTSDMKEPSKVLLYSPKSTLVKTLLKAYRAETLDFSKPLTTGGGTYAKHAPNTVAFGALFPKRESTMHEPNEYMPLKDFYKSAEIYAHAIHLLGELK